MSTMEQGIPPATPDTPTQNERTMATLAHILQLVGWFIAPLVIYFIRRQSRFVSFHALQAVFLQLVYMLVWIGFMVVWFALIFGTMAAGPQSELSALWYILAPLVWLVAMGMWLLLLITAIRYGIKAGRGEWAGYPVIGRWARRMVGN